MEKDTPEVRVTKLSALESAITNRSVAVRQLPERRKLRRANLHLRARVRPGEFDDGAFEEVAATLNASRKAFYFQTRSDRYRAGMRLRVSFPHDPQANSDTGDDIGEVVRVDQTRDGYGVAVVFWKAGEGPVSTMRSESARGERCGNTERRRHPRGHVVAAVELIDLPTGIRARATTSDLSMGGCYVNTLNPFRLGATLGVRIHHAQATLDSEATVCTRFEGSGMGLAFQKVTAEQRSVLEEWLPDENAALAGSANKN